MIDQQPLISTRSCFELGVCQSRKPACQGCSWQFAPGVIDGPYRSTTRWLTTERTALAGRAALILVALVSLSAILGFATGYFDLLGWLQ